METIWFLLPLQHNTEHVSKPTPHIALRFNKLRRMILTMDLSTARSGCSTFRLKKCANKTFSLALHEIHECTLNFVL